MSTRGDLRKLIRRAKRRGWKVVELARKRSATHHMLEWTDGTRISAALTPSDRRSTSNFIADLRRVERSTLDNGED